MGSSPSKDALAGGTGIVPGVSDAEHNPCVGPVSHDAVSIPHFLDAQAADGAPAGATPGGQIPQPNTHSTAPSAAATPPADGSESGGSAVATPPVAVPSISGIEAAVDLAAAAGAERDGDGLLLTQEVAQKGKVDFFSAHASMLSPFLRVSSAEPATRRALLHAAGVGVVVNAAADAVPCKFRRDGVPYTSLCVADTSSTELSNLFPAICALLKAAEQASVPALVHCHQGVSRSGTLAVAYIMWRWGADLDTAVAAARRVRGIISPNPGFRLQLQEWGWWLARWREGPAVSSLADLPWVPAGEAAAAGGVPRSSPDGKWTLCDITLDPAAPLPVYSAARLAPGMFDVAAVPVTSTTPAQLQLFTASAPEAPSLESVPCFHPHEALPPSFKVVPAEGKADTATGAVLAQPVAPGFAAFTCRKLLIPRRCDTTHLPLAPARDALVSTSVTLLTHAPGGPLPPLAVWVGAEVAPEVVEACLAAVASTLQAWKTLFPALAQQPWAAWPLPLLKEGSEEAAAFAAHLPATNVATATPPAPPATSRRGPSTTAHLASVDPGAADVSTGPDVPPLAPRGAKGGTAVLAGAGSAVVADEEEEEDENPSMYLGRPSLYSLANSGTSGSVQWDRCGEYDDDDLVPGSTLALVVVGAGAGAEGDDAFDISAADAPQQPHTVYLWAAAHGEGDQTDLATAALHAHYTARELALPPGVKPSVQAEVSGAESDAFWEHFEAGF